ASLADARGRQSRASRTLLCSPARERRDRSLVTNVDRYKPARPQKYLSRAFSVFSPAFPFTVRPMSVTLADIRAAQRRIAGGVIVTPCAESIPLSEITGARVVCKLENFQRTGSFKERGARNALLRLTPAQRERGVVAASAGNHALGLTYHGKLLRVPVTVVMPDYAPLIKITTCERLGARVIVRGRDFAEARAYADELVANE